MKRMTRLLSLLLAGLMCVQMTGVVTQAQSAPSDPLYQEFQTPADDTKPRPLWFWNREVEDMTTEQVREIVRESYLQSGYNGFGILPQWQGEYLSDEYFELYEAALDEGSKYGMHFSLYDENGFPSYNAGGLLEEYYPDLTTKRLDKFEKDGADGETVRVNLPEGKFMGAVAMNTDTMERVEIDESNVTIVPPKPYDPSEEPIGVSASTTYSVSPGYGPEMAVDGDLTTRWNSESFSGGNQYLQIRFTQPTTFDSVRIYEDKDPQLHRTAKYAVQYWNYETGSWEELASGKKITDAGVEHSFAPVTSDLVRLRIKQLNGDSASISEFQIFSGDQQLEVPQAPEVIEPGYYASSIFNPDYAADKAFDGDRTTRWNAGDGVKCPHWLELSFGSGRTVDSVTLYEHLNRITGYQIQYYKDGEWLSCASGTSIGEDGATLRFDPVQTERLRLYITSTSDYNPTIWEFEAYGNGERLVPDEIQEEPYDGSYLEYQVPEGNWKVMAFLCVKDGNNGMDYLDPASVRAFIDITYETYYKRLRKYFDDGTINMAFFDEPSFWPAGGRTPYGAQGARFWTPAFNEEYEKIFDGQSPVLDYPALFYDIGEDTDQARDRMQYVRTELFANNYIGQINDWCTDHGLKLTGHMLFEEWTNPVGLHGDLMKVFQNQAVPGVDIIDYFGKSQESYKIVSSSANNWDKGQVMSESFGVFRGTDSKDFYRSALDQYAKGINMIIPHAVWYDDDPSYVTYVPELSYRNPQFKDDLAAMSEYFGRSGHLLQNGRHVADIAMLYPIDYLETSFLFNGQENKPADADYMRVGETLSLNARRDFTYLHPDIIDERCTVEGNTLNLNNTENYEQYKVFVLPGTQVISLSNLEKIKAFYDGGGKVIATTQLPTRATTTGDNDKVSAIIREMFGVDPATGEPVEAQAGEFTKNTNPSGGAAYFIKTGFETKLEAALDDALATYDVELRGVPSLSGGNFSYIHKVKDNRNLYFFANSSDTEVNATAAIRGELHQPMLWNPATGEKTAASYQVTEENGEKVTLVELSLSAIQGVFVVEEPTSEPPVPADTNKTILKKVYDYATEAKAGSEYAGAIGSVKASFDAAYEEAGRVYADETASQEEVDSAWMNLMKEIHKLGFQAGDKKQLELLLFEADKIDLSKYVEAGQAEFTAAVEKAENCYNDADALQGDVEEAVEALLNAMLNLRFKADKSLLTQLTEAAQQIDLSAYTSESVERFEAALAHAKATLDNEALSQDDQAVVDRAFDDLQTAIEGLAQADGTSSLAVNGDGTLSTATNSAKTGDTAPIALASALLLAGAAVVLCKKRGAEQ